MKTLKFILYGLLWEHPDNRHEDNARRWQAGNMSNDEFLHRMWVYKY